MTTTDEPFRPVIRTQADLERTWRHLLQPLGFSRSSIWMMVVDADDRPVPQLIEVEAGEGARIAEDASGFAELADELLRDLAPGGRWALLISRPGGSAVTAHDRSWARGLIDACRAHGVPTDVMHLASDTDVVPLPYDVLAQSA